MRSVVDSDPELFGPVIFRSEIFAPDSDSAPRPYIREVSSQFISH